MTPISHNDLVSAFPLLSRTECDTSTEILIDVGTSADRHGERLRAAKAGDGWHSNVLAEIGSMVCRGLSDAHILALAPELTLEGYTVDQTRKEMQRMIDGARRKGFDHPLVEASVEPEMDDPLAGYNIISALDLSNKTFAPVDWLISPLLPRPSLTMLAGPPKVGKSWLCLFCALQVAEAGHEVVYIASEDNDRRLKDRLVAVNPFPPDGIHFLAGLSCEKPLPKGDAALEFIKALKAKFPRLKCLVVDTLAAIRRQFPNKSTKEEYALAEEEFSALRRLAHELEISIIVVHHTRKSTDSEASPVESILGSQGIAATVETIMVMKQESGSQNVGLYVTGKDVEQQELVLPWQSPGFGWPKEMTEARLGTFQHKCLEFIRGHPRCMQGAIIAEFSCDKGQVSTAVNKLVERGLVTKHEGGYLVAK